MWLNIAFLLALMTPAQNSSQAQSPYQLGPVPLFQHLPRQFHQDRIDVRDQLAQQNSNMCFAIRSYIFKRADDSAPVLVKTMTCTPNTVFLQKAGHPSTPRLVPLKGSY